MKTKHFLCLASLVGCLSLLQNSAQGQSESPQERLNAITNDYWLREQKIGHAYSFAEPIFPDYLYKGTREDYDKDAAYFARVLANLKKIKLNKLPVSSQTDYDLMYWLATMRLEATRFYDNTFPPVTPYYANSLGEDFIFSHLALSNAEDLQRYLGLLHQQAMRLGAYLDKLKYLSNQGIRLPKAETEVAMGFMRSFHRAPSSLPYFVAEERLVKIETAARIDFQRQVSQILEQEIIPAFDKIADYLGGDYLSQAPEAVGLGQYPEGKAYYRHLVKWHTTTSLSPEAIFALGMQNVTRIRKSLDSLRILTGFRGELKDFYLFLQKDPRFLATTPDEVGIRLKGHLVRMEKVIPQLISTRTRTPYDVRRLPLELEPAMTFGYYHTPSGSDSVGLYLYNGSKLDQRSQVSAASLAFHEIMPGHHLQICLQKDNPTLPAFRRNLQVNAFLEGWGDYASHLGTELGLYQDPYDYCGRLLMEMFISVRLVVDVGMNDQGWSREQAMAFMRDNVIESSEQIKTETLRYSCDIPAQALSYKMGSMRLIELRNKYQNLLGSKFDVLRFHDAVLRLGCLPLAILEKSLDREFGVK